MAKKILRAVALLMFLFSSLGSAEIPPDRVIRAQDVCGTFDPLVADILSQTTAERWQDWIEKLSGAQPVWVDGRRTTIETRYSTAMFAGRQNARAFDFVHQLIRRWVDDDQIEIDDFPGYANTPWKNLIITFPGTTYPEEEVVLSAHLDSTSSTPFVSAPGANDNATGSAALLEAVRIFRNYSFERTVKVIFFTGEEWGMWGSRAYVRDHDTSNITGVINLDMFGFDSDDDRCFEMHVGRSPESDLVGTCVKRVIQSYGLNLTYDYLTDQARNFSDHSSFWDVNVGAVLLMENMFSQNQQASGGCARSDYSPFYHSPRDIFSNSVNVSTGFDIARAGLAAAASLAVPVEGEN